MSLNPSIGKRLADYGNLDEHDIRSEAARIHTEHELEKARLAIALEESRRKQAANVARQRKLRANRRATTIKAKGSRKKVDGDALEKTITLSDRSEERS